MTKGYRTLVRGKLRQISSLTVGGSLQRAGGADIQCARDGLGRLTLPGTGLAGCLVETAARIFPDLLKEATHRSDRWGRITSKTTLGPAAKAEMYQSLWHFWPAHRESEWLEWRQGVGIRQATGATAIEARALYDLETISPGEDWLLLMEIDSLRGGEKVEAIALLALAEWSYGRCWLGAGPARGLGWLQLNDWEVLRLRANEQAIVAWPNNELCLADDAHWTSLKRLKEVEILAGDEVAARAKEILNEPLPPDRFCYVLLEGTISASSHVDKDAKVYGFDALSVGGHAAGLLKPLADRLLTPRGVIANDFRAAYVPDTPVVTSGKDDRTQQPFVPGSGLRGPLRHAASRLHRGKGVDVPDPNVREKSNLLTQHTDPVSELFGLMTQCGRLLVSDARLRGDHYLLACLQHHAEDEFAAGVFGSSKFDRTVVLDGSFTFRMVIEGRMPKEMQMHLQTLKPALRLAELGYVPLGGGKWCGHGWMPWRFHSVICGWAGEVPKPLASPGEMVSVADSLAAFDPSKL